MPKALVEPSAVSLFMGLRVSIFNKFSLKEDWRITSLKYFERVKGR
jgi:hypothetical protein